MDLRTRHSRCLAPPARSEMSSHSGLDDTAHSQPMRERRQPSRRRLLGTTSTRLVARDRRPYRSCIREKQRRRAHGSYPCEGAPARPAALQFARCCLRVPGGEHSTYSSERVRLSQTLSSRTMDPEWPANPAHPPLGHALGHGYSDRPGADARSTGPKPMESARLQGFSSGSTRTAETTHFPAMEPNHRTRCP